MNDTSEKSVITNGEKFSLEPRNFEEAMTLCENLAQSTLIPKDFRDKPGDIMIALQMGREVGLPAMQAIQQIAVINGRPCIWGDAVPAIIKAHPLFEYMDEQYDEENHVAICKIKRHGEPAQIRTFSRDDAQKAGLTGKDIWKKYEKRMLQMRARGFCARDTFPDALKGLQIAEEQRDIIDMGDAERVKDQEYNPSEKSKERTRPQSRSGKAASTQQQDKPAAGGNGKISEGQARIIRAKLEGASIDETAFCKAYAIDCVESLSAENINDALGWVKFAEESKGGEG